MSIYVCKSCKRLRKNLNKFEDCTSCADIKIKIFKAESGDEKAIEYLKGLRKLLYVYISTDYYREDAFAFRKYIEDIEHILSR
jgi:hypothetical protein